MHVPHAAAPPPPPPPTHTHILPLLRPPPSLAVLQPLLFGALPLDTLPVIAVCIAVLVVRGGRLANSCCVAVSHYLQRVCVDVRVYVCARTRA